MRVGRAAALAITLLLVPFLAESGRAQEWTAEVQAGRFHYVGPQVDTVSSSLALGIRREGLRSGLLLSAAVPVRADDPIWGFAALWQRAVIERRGLYLGVDFSGHGFLHRYRDEAEGVSTPRGPPGLLRLLGPPEDVGRADEGFSAYGLRGDALPLIGYRGGIARLEARSGISHGYTELGDLGSLNRTLFVSDARLTLIPADFLSVRAEATRFGATEDAYAYAGITALLAHPRVILWASAGHWFSSEVEGVPWLAGAELQIHDRASLTVAGRHETFDPHYLGRPRRSWSVGLGYRLSEPMRLAAPVPASYVDGRVTILVPTADVDGSPLIAGDFNGWNPEPMSDAGRNWSYTTAIAPGVYNYAFVTADGEWFVPESVPGRKDDGMGGHVAVLVVH